ncbi:SNW domain-containing protein 1 [Salpingoeca rosetta]|uniref:SNW domain-containing protein 1 n=1 Tax=Salpingoeca rosetta (strain ATCC 50818 / BSB-021) TaxID=946362 RepID=F2TVX2_SALR5|nr:SNW domain-containing protein 1 [Salpingoeca rosetta]EGD72218.1 SNW domain-containing protein 1 [Salpingoeca rosetta]|eukprot:XP_004998789.1 SNW domain-containing protein 1 [Salpingoeca rosetta]
MATLNSLLPRPIHASEEDEDEYDDAAAAQVAIATSKIPPYGQRHGWRPRKVEDFGDGGAFPEIPMAQYPLSMGLKRGQKQKSSTMTLQVGQDGKVKYDALAKQGRHKNEIVHTSHKNLMPADVTADDDKRQGPSEEEIADTAKETWDALSKMVDGKVASARATHVQKSERDPTYIRYTPQQGGGGHNSGAQQRIIRMMNEQVDPLEPPKFRTNQKIPRGPPSPPAPVLHSPPRKVTAEEQRSWDIPPCISNWKNHKGFTVPLDKRMAADGRGLQDVTINDNFAKVAEALYIAERESRIAIQKRHEIRTRAAQKEKERQEESLRRMAERAREQRAGIRTGDDAEDAEGVMERDEIRKEREREFRRQRNIANAAPDKRSRLQRDDERDVTERIALGLGGPASKGVTYDSRLFGQGGGISAGFGTEDSYNVYDKPMRGTQAQSIYRPTRRKEVDADEEYEQIRTTDRFRADKGFSGTDSASGRASGPVQFEKKSDADDLDIGLSSFLNEAKEGSSKRRGDRDEGSSSSKRAK